MRSILLGIVSLFAAGLQVQAQTPRAPAAPGPAAQLHIRVIDDATSKAIDAATIAWQSDGMRRESTVATGADGTAVIDLAAAPRFLNVRIKSGKLVPMQVSWGRSGKQTLPTEFEIRLKPASVIGGLVKDSAGTPLTGVKVQFWSMNNLDGVPHPDLDGKPLETDSEGKWTFEGLNADATQLSISVYDFLHAPAEGFYRIEEVKDLATLRARTYVSVLPESKLVIGTVLDGSGNPVAGAKVGWGQDRMSSNVLPDQTTGDDGSFQFGTAPGSQAVLTVQAKGFGPALTKFEMPHTDKDVGIVLHAPTELHGKVFGSNGKPLSGASISVDTWRGCRTLRANIRSGKSGEFVWAEAPEDEVFVNVYGNGQVQQQIRLKAGEANEVHLGKPLVIRGTVVDADSGEPVNAFRVIPGGAMGSDRAGGPGGPGERIYWIRRRDVTPGMTDGTAGSFERTFEFAQTGYAVKVEADGFAPAVSRVFSMADGEQTVSFKLHKAVPVTGVVRDDKGAPVAGVKVCLVTAGTPVQVINGEFAPSVTDAPVSDTSSEGVYTFSPQSEKFVLVASDPRGYAKTPLLDKPGDLRLVPWSSVKGVAKIGSKPASGATIASFPVGYEDDSGSGSTVFFEASAVCAEDGTFEIARIPAGQVTVSREVVLGTNTRGYVAPVCATLEPGKTAMIALGGRGRPVTGKFVLPPEVTSKMSGGVVSGGLAGDISSLKPPPELKNMSPEQRQAWARTAPGKAFLAEERKLSRNARCYSFQSDAEGNWRVDDVEPGTYTINAYARAATNNMRFSDVAGQAAVQLIVGEIPGGRSDEPLTVPPINLETTSNQLTSRPSTQPGN